VSEYLIGTSEQYSAIHVVENTGQKTIQEQRLQKLNTTQKKQTQNAAQQN